MTLTSRGSHPVHTDHLGQVNTLLWVCSFSLSLRGSKSHESISGIDRVSKNDWIEMDHGYLDRLDERITAMEENPQWTLGVNDISSPAIIELFRQVMIEHVPKRFPTMFRIAGNTFTNLVTKKTYGLQKALQDPELALRILCRNVEEDFYLMCPDGEGDWRLQGYISCFPGGFDGPSRIGMSFRDIHMPVPHYKERIANGVDKFVRRMKAGELVQRFNVSAYPNASS
jgi:hypothetical protein